MLLLSTEQHNLPGLPNHPLFTDTIIGQINSSLCDCYTPSTAHIHFTNLPFPCHDPDTSRFPKVTKSTWLTKYTPLHTVFCDAAQSEAANSFGMGSSNAQQPSISCFSFSIIKGRWIISYRFVFICTLYWNRSCGLPTCLQPNTFLSIYYVLTHLYRYPRNSNHMNAQLYKHVLLYLWTPRRYYHAVHKDNIAEVD